MVRMNEFFHNTAFTAGPFNFFPISLDLAERESPVRNTCALTKILSKKVKVRRIGRAKNKMDVSGATTRRRKGERSVNVSAGQERLTAQ